MAINEQKSRKIFNLAIKKAKDGMQIVRYVNGFKNDPVVILRGIKTQADLEKKMERAISIIAQTSSQYGALVQLADKGSTVAAVLALEEAGIANSEVRIQSNGTMYFVCTADDELSAEKTIKEKLSDSGIPVKEGGITIVDKKHLPKDNQEEKAEEGKAIVEDAPATPGTGDTSDSDAIASIENREEYEIYATMAANPDMFSHPNEQLFFKKLEAKYGKIEIKKSATDEVDLSPTPSEAEKPAEPSVGVKDIKSVFVELAEAEGPFANDAEIAILLEKEFDLDTIAKFLAENHGLIAEYIK